MPLIILCGTPVSGKTTRSLELKEFFEKTHGKQVQIISEDEVIVKLGYDKNSTYLDSQKEKRVRGYLKSETLRLIGPDNVVILDGGNYIKGCRYELYCASKASKTTQCTIYTIRNHDEAWEANKQRIDRDGNTRNKDSNTCNVDLSDENNDSINNVDTSTIKDNIDDPHTNVETSELESEDSNNDEAKLQNCHTLAYTQEVFDALTKLRFEEPNSNNRWDSPLFTVQPTDELPLEDIYKVLFEKKPPPPNMSTQNPPLSSTNFLYELDKATQAINKHILDAKQLQVSGSLKFPDYPGCILDAGFTRLVSPQKLNILRRQFLTFAKMNYATENSAKIGRYFIQYLNKTLAE